MVVSKLVCVFTLRPFLFPYGEVKTQYLSSARKTDQADFTDWMSFLPFNFMEKISPKQKYLKIFISMEKLKGQ